MVLRKREEHSQKKAPQAEDIGDDLELEVYEGYDDEDAGEDQGRSGIHGEAESPGNSREEEGGEQLDRGIADRYGLGAFPALAPQDEIAYQRYVVVEPDGGTAPGAARTGPDDRFVSRYAEDADIEEASDDGAEDEGEDLEKKHIAHYVIHAVYPSIMPCAVMPFYKRKGGSRSPPFSEAK